MRARVRWSCSARVWATKRPRDWMECRQAGCVCVCVCEKVQQEKKKKKRDGQEVYELSGQGYDLFRAKAMNSRAKAMISFGPRL